MESPFRSFFEFQIQGLENLAVLSDLAGFFMSLFPSTTNALSLSLSLSLSLPPSLVLRCVFFNENGETTKSVRDLNRGRERTFYCCVYTRPAPRNPQSSPRTDCLFFVRFAG